MAIVYRGATNQLDERMLDVLRRLPDEYHVFTTFRIPNYGREIDFLVVRQSHEFGGIFCLEVKDETRRLKGTINGPWEYWDDLTNTWQPYPRPTAEDDNPLQQAYTNAAMFKRWLSSMRDIINDEDDPWTPEQVRGIAVFPRLVLSKAHEFNQIQYDTWVIRFDSYEETLTQPKHSLPRWRPKEPFYFSTTEVERIAEHLGMAASREAPFEFDAPALDGAEPDSRPLEDQVSALAAEVAALRRLVSVQAATIQELRSHIRHHDGIFERFAEVFARRGSASS